MPRDQRLETVIQFIERHGVAASIATIIALALGYMAAFQSESFLGLVHEFIRAPWLIAGTVALGACYLAINSLNTRIDTMERALDDLRLERDLERKLRFAVQRDWLHQVTTETPLMTTSEAWSLMDRILDRERDLFQRRNYDMRTRIIGEHER